jgi:plastocyanin
LYSNGGSGYASMMMPYGGSYGSYQMPSVSPYASMMPYGGSYSSPSYAATSATQEDVNVALSDNSFKPKKITVSVGTTVQWTNLGRHQHTVTSSTGLWDSGEMAPGERYSHTFTEAGTYPYYCTIHAQEMRGVVIVK